MQSSEITTLHVFDFDGTLVRSPQRDTIINVPGLGKATAQEIYKQWREIEKKPPQDLRGWHGCSETLKHPIFPRPLQEEMLIRDVADRFLESKNNPNVHTMLMTGRHVGLMYLVFEILKGYELLTSDDIRLQKVETVFYKRLHNVNSTFSWKTKKIRELSESYFNIEIWEDRPDHIEGFEQLFVELDHLDYYKVHRVG